MKKISILGAGKIGRLMAIALANAKGYEVQLLDKQFTGQIPSQIHCKTVDVTQIETLKTAIQAFASDALVSCLPYFLNIKVAKLAAELKTVYFDLTEDVRVTETIKKLAETSAAVFVPQCGLAPGLIGILANDLIQQFEQVDTVEMRVGALPQANNHPLKYALTWSTDGLINEYDNDCLIIKDGQQKKIPALSSLEHIQLRGCEYEAFSTSGGLGSLVEIYQNKIRNMNYKTIRYPGHCEKMRFLLQDLKLNSKREVLKEILESAIPKTDDDVVLMFVNVTGKVNGQFYAKHILKQFYPKVLYGEKWAAIQLTTALGLLSVLEIVLRQSFTQANNLVYQEKLGFDNILLTQFGDYFKHTGEPS